MLCAKILPECQIRVQMILAPRTSLQDLLNVHCSSTSRRWLRFKGSHVLRVITQTCCMCLRKVWKIGYLRGATEVEIRLQGLKVVARWRTSCENCINLWQGSERSSLQEALLALQEP